MSTLVDRNLLIDVLSEDARSLECSSQALAHAVEHGTLGTSPTIYAVLPADRFARLARPFAAGSLAGRAFVSYRRRGGARLAPLPDFSIGAHALVDGHTLLTRDPARDRAYFSKLKLIGP